MTTQLAKPNKAAPLPATSEHLDFSIAGEKPVNPLMFVSEGIRGALSYFWMCFSRLMPSIMPVAALLATWQKQGEINDEQIIEILRGLTRPERVAEFKFPSDLQCALAAEVTERIRRNKRDAAILARRKGMAVPARDEFNFAESFRRVIEGARKEPAK